MSSSGTDSLRRISVPRDLQALLALAFGILSALSKIALLAASAWLIVRASEQPPIMFLTIAVVGVRAFALSRAAFRYLERIFGHSAVLRSLGNLRVELFKRLLPLMPGYSGSFNRAETVHRLIGDVDRLQDFSLRVLQPRIVSAVALGVATVVVAVIHPPARLALLLILATAVAISISLSSLANRSAAALASEKSELAGVLDFMSTWSQTIVAFDGVDTTVSRIDAISRRMVQKERSISAALAGSTAVLSLGSALALSAMLYLTIPSLESLGAPSVAAIVLVPLVLFEIAAALPESVLRNAAVKATGKSLSFLGNEDAQFEEHESARFSSAPRLELKGVTARFPLNPSKSIRLPNLKLEPGAVLLITGASGSGKSTLANTLAGFLPYDGRILLNGTEMQSLNAMGRIIGLSEQQPWLFDTTIRHNLDFARPDVTETEMWKALHAVGLAAWTNSRGGLDAQVGEYGALVSGGQAQRIALARVLLAEFPILVLDEPTANVEPELASQLIHELLAAAISSNRTVILMSHVMPDVKDLSRSLRRVDSS